MTTNDKARAAKIRAMVSIVCSADADEAEAVLRGEFAQEAFAAGQTHIPTFRVTCGSGGAGGTFANVAPDSPLAAHPAMTFAEGTRVTSPKSENLVADIAGVVHECCGRGAFVQPDDGGGRWYVPYSMMHLAAHGVAERPLARMRVVLHANAQWVFTDEGFWWWKGPGDDMWSHAPLPIPQAVLDMLTVHAPVFVTFDDAEVERAKAHGSKLYEALAEDCDQARILRAEQEEADEHEAWRLSRAEWLGWYRDSDTNGELTEEIVRGEVEAKAKREAWRKTWTPPQPGETPGDWAARMGIYPVRGILREAWSAMIKDAMRAIAREEP